MTHFITRILVQPLLLQETFTICSSLSCYLFLTPRCKLALLSAQEIKTRRGKGAVRSLTPGLERGDEHCPSVDTAAPGMRTRPSSGPEREGSRQTPGAILCCICKKVQACVPRGRSLVTWLKHIRRMSNSGHTRLRVRKPDIWLPPLL